MTRQRRSTQDDFALTEHKLALAAGIEFLFYLVYLLSAALGIVWLKVTGAIVTIVLSLAFLAFLVLFGEHKRRRSRWLICGFSGMLICTLVSLILGYPAP